MRWKYCSVEKKIRKSTINAYFNKIKKVDDNSNRPKLYKEEFLNMSECKSCEIQPEKIKSTKDS